MFLTIHGSISPGAIHLPWHIDSVGGFNLARHVRWYWKSCSIPHNSMWTLYLNLQQKYNPLDFYILESQEVPPFFMDRRPERRNQWECPQQMAMSSSFAFTLTTKLARSIIFTMNSGSYVQFMSDHMLCFIWFIWASDRFSSFSFYHAENNPKTSRHSGPPGLEFDTCDLSEHPPKIIYY